MLQIKRKREEEAVPLIFVTKSSISKELTIPLKRRKQGNNCNKIIIRCAYINKNQVFILFKTLEAESITKFEQEHEKRTIETSNEQDEESRQNEMRILNIEKSHEYTESIFEPFAKDYVYDMYMPLVYTPDTLQTNPICFGILTLEEDNDISFLEETDSYDKYNDDEDSNEEDFYQNSYPDEDEWPNSDVEEREI
ncbi:hypothetical protein PNEG_01782 [Pneumocystis murina B123]|uniref:Transcription factor Iwr1 domain-containing protein n=1 Tax=Pneumocystis murina (strain B123) TaxID=1069680 RepID=M7NMW9_PNEMU|nr:hypothetical protein PNEG_01782 [Pneumocystis murina B123]EMR10028.1 hypothetical protein PNEG_01782 [Pneumocystis murina B123]